MHLLPTYKTKEEIPKGIEGLYTEVDGVFTLNKIDGMTTKAEIDAFRENNIKVNKDNEDLQKKIDEAAVAKEEAIKAKDDEISAMNKKFEGVDMDEINKLKAKQADLDSKKTMTMPDVDNLIQEKLANASKAFDEKQAGNLEAHKTEISKLQETIAIKQDRLYKQKVVDQATLLAKELGAHPGATNDITARMHKDFVLDENDDVIGKNPDGTTMYQKDGVTKVDMRSAMVSLKEGVDSKHLFKPVPGSGALGSGNIEPPINKEDRSTAETLAEGLKNYSEKK